MIIQNAGAMRPGVMLNLDYAFGEVDLGSGERFMKTLSVAEDVLSRGEDHLEELRPRGFFQQS